ncbi:MAG: preprotein translocase subunit SecG [Candidatus Sumerlaeota bacterium]|nr:preprotein translocase subunit SecG [Candidatus Sumerlaeota bacterium]
MLPWFFWLLLLVFIGVCVFLIFVILLQAGKGGGLSGLVSGGAIADQLGTTSAERTLNRWTTYCAVSFALLAVILTLIGAHYATQSSIVDTIENAPSAQQTGALPSPAGAPAEGTEQPAEAPSVPAAEASPGAAPEQPATAEGEVGVQPAPAGALPEQTAPPAATPVSNDFQPSPANPAPVPPLEPTQSQ